MPRMVRLTIRSGLRKWNGPFKGCVCVLICNFHLYRDIIAFLVPVITAFSALMTATLCPCTRCEATTLANLPRIRLVASITTRLSRGREPLIFFSRGCLVFSDFFSIFFSSTDSVSFFFSRFFDLF